MRTFLTLIVAVAILAGAYVVTYGLPPAIAAMIAEPDAAETATAAAPEAPARGPRAGGRRGPGGGARGTVVVSAPLEMLPHESVLNSIGTARALRSVDVVTSAAGEVVEANLAANRTVEAGEVLVRLDARTQVLNLEIAQARLDQIQDTVSRYERLRSNGNSTVTEVTLSEARMDLRLAEAAVGLAQVALDDRTIRAPITGRIGLSDVGIGDMLATNTAIASIDQSDALIVEFELPERAIGLLSGASTVLASTSTFTGRVFEGEIVSFDSRIDSVTRSVTVKARIENPKGELWPGMTFAVRLMQESEPLPSLPSTAITWSRAGSAVWVEEDGLARQVPVTILFRQDERVWLDAEIAEGTMVVTEGAQKLRPGARIIAPGGEEGRGRRPAATERGPRTSEDAPAARGGEAGKGGRQPGEGGQRAGADPRPQPATEEPT
ncbi:efflux RND transporter periplasmic adaptor subunit [Oceaniglobus trochenteri]|uniref:efflux RND transporter periplasmic adaptor subunit n=1 Tax=Oceaniglobus trochenteri TaxID=2763260 RepID=UPI001D001095|nr:efflux RND transporter periplasmic adaptor subunit [Oceaniglobus trochenteri]